MSADSRNMPRISIIAAMGKNREIGLGDSLPWNLKEDLQYFREKTINKPVIMGQKTFQSLGKALPDRTNIVLGENFDAPDCLKASSIEDALEKAGDVEEIMIIGGASVYQQFLPLADRMYLTLIDKEFKADVFFPEFSSSQWVEVERKEQESIQYKYSFVVLDKN
jgi:dihydrofolate reductase